MRGYLVFDSGPDLVGVYKRQCRFAAQGPGAQQQPWFVAHGIARTLGIGMQAEVGLEIVPEDSLQRLLHLLASQRSIDSVDSRHPCANDSVREASGSILILGAFAL